MDFPFAGDGQQSFTATSVSPATPAANNVKGAWTEITPSLPVNSRGLVFQTRIVSTNRRTLTDIGIGAGGSEIPLINNIFCSSGGDVIQQQYYFPIEIPQGTRISARYQTNNTTSINTSYVLTFLSEGFLPSVGYNRSISLGETLSSSSGFALTPGGSNLKSAWSQVSAGVNQWIGNLWCTVAHGGGDFTVDSTADYLLDIGIGPSNAERIIVPNILFTLTANGDTNICYDSFWYPVDIPPNTRIAIRAQTSIASSEIVAVMLYGV